MSWYGWLLTSAILTWLVVAVAVGNQLWQDRRRRRRLERRAEFDRMWAR